MTRKRKTKPFPWTCPRCLKDEVRPSTIEYSTQANHDGRLYDVAIPEFVVPTCPACGELVFCNDTDEQITRALRDKLGLLQPVEIRTRRKRLGLTQKALAEHIGVAQETISRWESGLLIQSRAMDTLLRVFFDFPNVRYALGAELVDSETAGNWVEWVSTGAALYTTLMPTSAILYEQAQAITVPEGLVGLQWPIVVESSWQATDTFDVPAGSPPRIAA